jgi:hypothetical protein
MLRHSRILNALAEQSGVLIYSIGILSDEEPREARRAKHALHELAVASGVRLARVLGPFRRFNLAHPKLLILR